MKRTEGTKRSHQALLGCAKKGGGRGLTTSYKNIPSLDGKGGTNAPTDLRKSSEKGVNVVRTKGKKAQPKKKI